MEGLINYIIKERAAGVADEIIRQRLLSKGWNSTIVNSALLGQLTGLPSSTQSDVPVQPNIANVTLSIGLVVVMTALAIFLGYGWPEYSPVTRVAVFAIPTLLLYLIGIGLLHEEQLASARRLVYFTAHLLLPFTFGVFLYQFQLVKQLDEILVTYSVLLALPLYLVDALAKKRDFGFAFSSFAIVAAVLALATKIKSDWPLAYDYYEMRMNQSFPSLQDNLGSILLIIALGALAFYLVRAVRSRGVENAYELVSSASIMAVLLGVIVTTNQVYIEITQDAYGYSVLLVQSVMFILVALLYGKLIKDKLRMDVIIQRFVLFLAVIMTVFLVDLSWIGRVLAVILLLGVYAVSVQGSVRSLGYTSLAMGAILIFSLLFTQVNQITVILALLIAGFLIIFGGIVLARRSTSEQKPAVVKKNSLDSLGLISDETASSLSDDFNTGGFFISIIFFIATVITLLSTGIFS